MASSVNMEIVRAHHHPCCRVRSAWRSAGQAKRPLTFDAVADRDDEAEKQDHRNEQRRGVTMPPEQPVAKVYGSDLRAFTRDRSRPMPLGGAIPGATRTQSRLQSDVHLRRNAKSRA
jgi:hypothetical protein